jgi:hypothetical protein
MRLIYTVVEDLKEEIDAVRLWRQWRELERVNTGFGRKGFGRKGFGRKGLHGQAADEGFTIEHEGPLRRRYVPQSFRLMCLCNRGTKNSIVFTGRGMYLLGNLHRLW